MLVLILASALSVTASQPTGVRIDGDFSEWAAVASAVVDAADAPDGYVDLREVKVRDDGRYVHFFIDFGKVVNPHVLDGVVFMPLDVDGDDTTGTTEHGLTGTDIVVEFSSPSGAIRREAGEGLGVWSTAGAEEGEGAKPKVLSPYALGISFAPAHATSQLEMRIDRTLKVKETPLLFHGAGFRGKLVFVDAAGAVADETEIFVAKLESAAGAAVASPVIEATTLAKPAEALRVMSWNVARGAILTSPEPFARAMRLLQPDVVMLVELPGGTQEEELTAWFDKHLPASEGTSWSALVGEGGGDLRTAVVSRGPLSPVEGMGKISRQNSSGRQQSVRSATAALEWKGKRLAFTVIHTKCCGRMGSSEDLTRISEATAVSQAWKKSLASEKFDGAVMAGDFNLVGSVEPLTLLLTGLDVDGSDLVAASAYQLDGTTNATWADPDQPFVPGRLDYLLYSDSSLLAANAWVYDSMDLPESIAQPLKISPRDTASASDHLPIVVDLKVKR